MYFLENVSKLHKECVMAEFFLNNSVTVEPDYKSHWCKVKMDVKSMARIHSAETGRVYIFQLPQTVSPSVAVQKNNFG